MSNNLLFAQSAQGKMLIKSFLPFLVALSVKNFLMFDCFVLIGIYQVMCGLS